MKIKSSFNVLRVQLERSEEESPPDLPFINKFAWFLEENGEKIVLLEEESLKTKEFYIETMLFLGEPERILKNKKSSEVLKEYAAFFEKFNKLIKDL